jgi:hypothetical protein
LNLHDESFYRYFQHVRRWSHVFRINDQISGPILNELNSTKVSIQAEALASDRQGNPIAVKYLASAGQRASGPFVALVPPTEISAEEAIAVILNDVFGIAASEPEPLWLGELVAPGEAPLRAAHLNALSELEATQYKASSSLEALNEARSPLRIIYQQHYKLQDSVADVFRRIGFETLESPVSDEFIIALDGRCILVEVKGSGKSASQKHLSQLAKDVDTYFGRLGKVIKGVLVSNAWIKLPPPDREPPNFAVFPVNVVEFAELKRLALLDTRSLLTAYGQVIEGRASAAEIFALIMDSEGVVHIAD